MLKRWWRALEERVDAALVRGQLWFLVLFALAVCAVALVAAAVIDLLGIDFGRGRLGFGRAAWQTMVRTMDPGQLADDRGVGAFVMLGVALIGLVLVSSLIALMTNKVQQRVEEANRGRTPVPLEDHFVILGWSEITLKVLEQLYESAAPGPPPPTVVMGAPPISFMRQRIDERRRDVRHERALQHAAGTALWSRNWPRLRTGNPTDKRDLERIARLHDARAVIVLSPDVDGDTNGDRGDDRAGRIEHCTSHMVETVLAVNAELEERALVAESRRSRPAASRSSWSRWPTTRPRPPSSCGGWAHAEPASSPSILDLRANLAAQVSRRPGPGRRLRRPPRLHGQRVPHRRRPPGGRHVRGGADPSAPRLRRRGGAGSGRSRTPGGATEGPTR